MEERDLIHLYSAVKFLEFMEYDLNNALKMIDKREFGKAWRFVRSAEKMLSYAIDSLNKVKTNDDELNEIRKEIMRTRHTIRYAKYGIITHALLYYFACRKAIIVVYTVLALLLLLKLLHLW